MATAEHRTLTFSPVDDVDPFDAELKRNLVEMILWAERSSPRSQQVEIGPSEMGAACDRRIGYQLAGVTKVNTMTDPWPAIVGTAVHAWLEKAVSLWNENHLPAQWLTEQTILFPEFGGKGHSDLYRLFPATVIDWKTASKDVMRKVEKEGPPDHYITQVQLYAYGCAQQGRPVERVALAFVPRAGWIKDMFVWSTPYDEAVARDCIGRMFRVAGEAMALDVLKSPHRWEQVPATPSDACGICPWFNSLRTQEQGASDLGCPGH